MSYHKTNPKEFYLRHKSCFVNENEAFLKSVVCVADTSHLISHWPFIPKLLPRSAFQNSHFVLIELGFLEFLSSS